MSDVRGESSQEGGWAGLVAALTRMAPGLVHELRNPLSGILAGSEMLGRYLPPSGPGRDYWEIVREEGKQLEGFLAQLAEFGRLSASRLPGPGRVELEAVARRLCDELQPEARTAGVALLCEPLGAAVVPGDPAWLGRALRELVRNGLQACRPGGRVALRLAAGAADAAELLLEDDGEGMTPETCARAGEPFFSLRPRALGLGLPLADAILRAHGGSLRLESQQGQGTRARIRLPLADPPTPAPRNG